MLPDQIQFYIMIAAWVAAVSGIATVVAAFCAAIWAKNIGNRQNEINNRFLALQDYVAISVVPDKENEVIKLLNIGSANAYLHGFDMPGNTQRLQKPRLISAGISMADSYWIPFPKIPDPDKNFNFEFTIYLTDQFDVKWISENAGECWPVKIEKDGKEVTVHAFKIWSHKTFKSDWSF